MCGFLWWHLKVRLKQQIGAEIEYAVGYPFSSISFQFPSLEYWKPTCDLGAVVACNENTVLYIFALNLVNVRLFDCCGFCANSRPQLLSGQLQVTLNLMTTKSRLGTPPWEDQVALLYYLTKWIQLLSQRSYYSHKGPKPEHWLHGTCGSIYHQEIAKPSPYQACARCWDYSWKKNNAGLHGICTI